MKLYHYVHCPFCIRVRMALGFLNISYESIVLPYNDEKTPIELTGTKMLPIMDFGDSIINESLDIIEKLDKKNIFKITQFTQTDLPKIDNLLNILGKDVHNLAMPYFIYTNEFNEDSRQYFQSKKEIKRGPFSELIKRKDEFISNLNINLKELELSLSPYYQSKEFGLKDILIASHLWALYIVPEFQFSETIHNYLQQVKNITNFDYHEDYWK